jgi:hypothetical protein
MKLNARDPGKITTEQAHIVWCATCNKIEVAFTADILIARKTFRDRGWRKTRDIGWVCDAWCRERK